MYIYRGKLNFSPSNSQNATYEAITIMFPSKFRLGDPVYTCWQWSTSGNRTNMPCWLTGTIESVANSDTDGNKIGFHGGSDYRFDGLLSGSKGIEELSLMVQSGNIIGTAINTKLVFQPDPGSSIDPVVPRIYLGRLANWAPYSVDQTLLVVIPGRIIGEGKAICAFWQWTVDATGARKSNVDFTPSIMTNVLNVADIVSFRFTTGYYTFHAAINLKETAEQQNLTLAMMNPSNESTGSLMLELQDLRPPASAQQPRRIDDSTTVAVQDRDNIIAQLESKLRAAEDQKESLNKKLLELEAARERDRLTAQETQNQGSDETELSDDEDNRNELALHDDKEDDFNTNQPT